MGAGIHELWVSCEGIYRDCRHFAETYERYGTREFEVTTERLGCYQPTEHIDNPLGYAEGEDARDYDPRLRGPVDEEQELAVDSRTGMKSDQCGGQYWTNKFEIQA